METGLLERPPATGHSYFSFTDPSGGSSDSMTCAVCHREGGLIMLDAVREIRAPFVPESATSELVAFLRSYGIQRTTGDRYASQWVQQASRSAASVKRHRSCLSRPCTRTCCRC